MEVNSNKKLKPLLAAFLIALILIAAGIYLYIYNKPEQRALREYRKVTQNFFNVTTSTVDFFRDSRQLEALLSEYSGFLPLQEQAGLKITLGNSLSGIDPARATQILKEVALSLEYPNGARTLALTLIADNYELDFTDKNFAKSAIFTGPVFEELLSDSGGNDKLAMRKLNEWSNALFPNVAANYRIAGWYAEELYKNPNMSSAERAALTEKIDEHIAAGDSLLLRYRDSMAPARTGIALQAKARVLHLAGRGIESAESAFRSAISEYSRQPQTIFQSIMLENINYYYAAFLARNYGQSRAEEIRSLLSRSYNYLSTEQRPEKRNVRLVSLLVAARNSQSSDYPTSDFNRNDIELISQMYPEFGLMVNNLDLAEYVKGHPLESYIRQ